MKKYFFLLVLLVCSTAAFSQTLISYGNNTISKEEFLRAYNKNKPATADREKSMREYLDMYTDFKLKVKAAELLRLDTVSQIRYDIQNFRDQITDNYLSNEKAIQLLVDEAAIRSAKDLHVLYFSVPVAPDAIPADTLKAFRAANELYNRFKKGNAEYEKTTAGISAELYPAKFRDIGYITAFSVNYDIENIIYNTKPGFISEPYRTAKGWVLFKTVEERPAAGKWKTAQLLFAYPPNADQSVKLSVKNKADSVYNLLQKGLSFSEAAKLYSDDRLTYMGGGELPEFSTGKYSAAFEANVYNLKNDNDISSPFETALGYHIVKRLAQTPVPTDKKDPTYQFELKQKLMQDSRIYSEKEKFAKEIFVGTGFRRINAVADADLYRYADTLMKNPTEEMTNSLPISKKAIIIFKDGTQVKGDEWLKFVRVYNSNPEQKKLSDKVLAEKFFAASASDYYKKHLEFYNTDFKFQMQEFKEGNMLFEIMERNVWSKAGADSAGLIAWYNAHKQNYKWAASADVLMFNCADEKVAAEVKEGLEKGKSWLSISENSAGRIQADSGRYEIAQLPGAALIINPAPGAYSPIIKNSDGSVVIIKFIKIYAGDLQRNFSEARGLVINDYQNVLERQWVQALRKQYPVKVNETVFKQIIN